MGGCKIGSLRGLVQAGNAGPRSPWSGVFGRDRLALPVGEPIGEGPVPGDQVGDPLAGLAG